ncbi:MAG: TetR/AcrR family transcriptional regulator, partial [Cloacibacterium sp.]
GYFRTDVPINLYIKFLISLLFAVDVSPIFEDEKDKFPISIAMKIFYLEAIVTDKGKKNLMS